MGRDVDLYILSAFPSNGIKNKELENGKFLLYACF